MTDKERIDRALHPTDPEFVGDPVSLCRLLATYYRAASTRADSLAEECRLHREEVVRLKKLFRETASILESKTMDVILIARWMATVEKEE